MLGGMLSRDAELEVQALRYLLTAVIHRLHETDREWWRDLLEEIKGEYAGRLVGGDDREVIESVIRILEHAVS